MFEKKFMQKQCIIESAFNIGDWPDSLTTMATKGTMCPQVALGSPSAAQVLFRDGPIVVLFRIEKKIDQKHCTIVLFWGSKTTRIQCIISETYNNDKPKS